MDHQQIFIVQCNQKNVAAYRTLEEAMYAIDSLAHARTEELRENKSIRVVREDNVKEVVVSTQSLGIMYNGSLIVDTTFGVQQLDVLTAERRNIVGSPEELQEAAEESSEDDDEETDDDFTDDDDEDSDVEDDEE